MASVLTAPNNPAVTPEGITLPIPDSPDTMGAAAVVHAVPAKLEIHMGRAATVKEGVNWLTLTVILTGILWIPYILNRCQVR